DGDLAPALVGEPEDAGLVAEGGLDVLGQLGPVDVVAQVQVELLGAVGHTDANVHGLPLLRRVSGPSGGRPVRPMVGGNPRIRRSGARGAAAWSGPGPRR